MYKRVQMIIMCCVDNQNCSCVEYNQDQRKADRITSIAITIYDQSILPQSCRVLFINISVNLFFS